MKIVQRGSLEGKVALVTGGSKGIGASIVRRLADQGAGVAFTYSTRKKLLIDSSKR
jgi:NAD(P)-dependent dehydrogenase (short-subunit alcohol dehydrogenase family)